MNLSEIDIIAGIKAGNEQIFEFVFHKYYSGLCAYASKLLNNNFMAEEIVTSMFAKLWEKRETLDPKSSIKFYLFRSVLNQCINHIKHIGIEKEHSKNVFTAEMGHIDSDSDQEDKIQYILNCIDALPPQCKKVFVLSRFEGYKYLEIALELGISEKTVEGHISNALKTLRLKKDSFKT